MLAEPYKPVELRRCLDSLLDDPIGPDALEVLHLRADSEMLRAMPQTAPPPLPDEIRRLMHLDWAERVAGGPPLEDIDRAANLRDIVASPYHDLAFREISLNEIMLISIYHLMERHEWSQVWRAAAKLHRMERDAETRRARSDSIIGRPASAKTAPPPEAAALPPKAAPPAPTAPQAESPTRPPLPSRAALLTFSTKKLMALCAQHEGLSVADVQQFVSPEPPFT